MHWPTTWGCDSKIWHHALPLPSTGASTAGVLGLLPQGECEKTGKVQLRAATMVQCLECRCGEIEVEGAGLVFPSERKPKGWWNSSPEEQVCLKSRYRNDKPKPFLVMSGDLTRHTWQMEMFSLAFSFKYSTEVMVAPSLEAFYDLDKADLMVWWLW